MKRPLDDEQHPGELEPVSSDVCNRVSETQGTADWISCKVSDYEFEMENAVMEPSYKSRKFLLYGNDPDTDGS